MLANLRFKAACLALAVATVSIGVVPAAQATQINHDFTLDVTSGPLAGTVSHGSFAYDDSSIVPGGYNQANGLLTALDFTFNGTAYNGGNTDTYYLGFDAAGNLTSFTFGNNCHYLYLGTPICAVQSGTDQWFTDYVESFQGGFTYSTPQFNDFGYGNVTLDSASASVPEPGTFGMVGLGAFMIGLLVCLRRRRRTY